MTALLTDKCPKCGHIWQVRTLHPVRCPHCGYRLTKRIETGDIPAKSAAGTASENGGQL